MLNPSTAENALAAATLPRRLPSQAKPSLDVVFDPPPETETAEDAPKRHMRLASKHRRQQSSMSWPPLTGPHATRPSVVGLFDLTDGPSPESLDDDTRVAREIITTPATPPGELADDEETRSLAKARLSSFSFGSKATAPLLPSLPLRRSSPDPSRSRPLSHHSPTLDLPGAPTHDGNPLGDKEERSPRQRRRHSHNRSASISLPNLKLGGRPASLGVTSPALPSTPSTPSIADTAPRPSRQATPKSSNRLRFEPSDKEKEESRRRALEKLTGGDRHEEPPSQSIMLPALDDDDDDFSTSSSRPPSDALNSTASSSRPSSFTFPSAASSLNGSQLPWATGFDEAERWSFGQRFDHPKEEVLGFGFDLASGPKTCSVLVNSNLGVLAEEDETEPETEPVEQGEDEDTFVVSPPTVNAAQMSTPPPAAPTPSKLRELHLVSSVSTAGSSRRSSNPEALQAYSRAAAAEPSPTKAYGTIGRGRPNPLEPKGGSTRPVSMNSLIGRRPVLARSSISYKKDGSGSGSSRGAMSPPSVTSELASSPTTTTSALADWSALRNNPRACPRPRSAIIGGTSGRVLGEVDEAEEKAEFPRDDSGMSEASRDSFDGLSWGRRRDSRERIDAEMERDALREDVDLWRKRCRGLEDRLEVERREITLLRDRVRKLGDRLLKVSSATDVGSPTEEHEATQSRLIAEMRDQLFSLTSALERERKDKMEAQARASELESALDASATPHVTPRSLPSTPKSRPHLSSLTNMSTPPEAKYADADYGEDVDDVHVPVLNANDPNLNRMRGWGFPHGPVSTGSDKENKRESFFGLSRPRAVRAPPTEAGLGLDWVNAPGLAGLESGFDLPPIEVNDANRDVIIEAAHTAPRDYAALMTPERQLTSPLAFLTGYLPIARRPVPIPRVTITPSSVSPKKPLKHLEHYGSFIVPGCEVDFRHSCCGCEGPVMDL